ncbi:MAG TPA: 4'-phosphopantetheinyl transferase superfamily protein [Xanthomonadales bacterium]|nr:4'-phosphopantetheinyl transferase superfamily protein [Xanthomonadales bacterium]
MLSLDWTQRTAAAPAPVLGAEAVHLWLLDARARSTVVDALLAAYAGVDAVTLAHDAHGKPLLPAQDHGGPTLHFNLAHSGERLLLAVGHADLGVDLEHERRIRRRDALLARCFTPREQAAIRGAADPQAALLGAWTAKEAVVKAIGRGIAYGLKKIELALDGNAPQLDTLEGPAAPASAWTLATFVPEPGYRAALAVRGTLGSVSAYRCT